MQPAQPESPVVEPGAVFATVRTNGSFMPLTDPDIRAALWERIGDESADCDAVMALHEFPVQSRYGFVDVVVVNGEMIGYEIKSDVDSTRRLAEQVSLYDGLFDRFYCVTTNRHLDRVRSIVPKRWGIIVADRRPVVVLAQRRQARLNARPNVRAILCLLSRSELLSLAKAVGLRGYSRNGKSELAVRLAALNRSVPLRSIVRETLRARSVTEWTPRQRSRTGREIRR